MERPDSNVSLTSSKARVYTAHAVDAASPQVTPRGVGEITPRSVRSPPRFSQSVCVCAWPTLTEKQGKKKGNRSQETKERIRGSIAPKPPDKRREQPRIKIEQTAQQRGSYRLPAKVLANRPEIAAKEAKTYQRSGAKDNNNWPCGTNQNNNHNKKSSQSLRAVCCACVT